MHTVCNYAGRGSDEEGNPPAGRAGPDGAADLLAKIAEGAGGGWNILDPADLDRIKATKICPGCKLYGADLRSGDLAGANLSGADLSSANLTGADLSGTIMPDYRVCGANSIGECK